MSGYIRTNLVRSAFRAALLMRALHEIHTEDLVRRVNHPRSGQVYANMAGAPLATMVFLMEIDPETDDAFELRLLERAETLLNQGFQEEFRRRVLKDDPFVKTMVELFPVRDR